MRLLSVDPAVPRWVKQALLLTRFDSPPTAFQSFELLDLMPSLLRCAASSSTEHTTQISD